ncbi:DUF3530 family protein [Gammaproteobacteria bacterium AS21]
MKKIIFIYFLTLFASYSQAAEESTEQDSAPTTDTQAPASETSTPQAITRTLTNTKKAIANDIGMLLSSSLTEVIQLNALDEDFDIYFLGSEDKEPIGSILFFPDERNHSNWPVTLQPLRTKLTSYNWQTAVITLPNTQLEAMPKRTDYSAQEAENTAGNETEAAENNQTSSDDTTNTETQALTQNNEEQSEATSTMAETVIARAQATVIKLKEQSDVIIIIGIGQGATWATAYAATLEEADKENSKLILINPLQSQDLSSPTLNETIGNLKIDVIDIYTPQETSSYYADQALARKRAANRADIEQYLQIKAPSFSWTKAGNQWLYRKVRGILKNQVEQKLAEKEALESAPTPPEKINQAPGAINN